MAHTIAYEGVGVVADAGGGTYPADGTAGAAAWTNVGGGTTAAYNPDAFVQGTESVGCKYPNKDGQVYVTLASTYSFAAAGNAEGQFVYIWMNIQSNGQFDTIGASPPGLSIIMGTNINNYRRWAIAGDANDNGWGSGWKCFVIDPTTAGETDQGTYNSSTINIVGIDINSDTSVRADSIFIDEITIAKGLRVTGSATAGDSWGEIKTWCMDTPGTRRFGFLDEREGVYYVKGKLFVGAATGNTVFNDDGKIIKFETTEYYNGTAWVSSVPSTFAGIELEDGTGTTIFEDGILVGTDNGRSGSSYIGNENEEVSLVVDALTNAASDVNLYGTKFNDFTGVINFEADANHAVYAVAFQRCAQVVPASAVFRNVTIAETISTLGGLLWSAGIDIESSQFIANTTGAAIQIATDHGADGEEDFTSLLFSGNTFDVNNTTGSALTVNKLAGSDPSTSTGSAVTFSASFAHILIGLTQNTEVTYVLQSNGTVVFHVEDVPVTGTTTYTHGGGELVDVLIFHIDKEPEVSNIYDLTLPSADTTVKVSQFDDPNYFNP